MRIQLPVGAVHKALKHNGLLDVFTYNDGWRTHIIRPFQPDTEPITLYQIVNGGKHSNRYGITKEDNALYYNGNDMLFSPGIKEPICGWDWLLNREHPPVNYEITINAFGCKHTILLNPDAHNGKVIEQVSQAILKPNKEERKYINAQRRELLAAHGYKLNKRRHS